jgi:hypothetical protein
MLLTRAKLIARGEDVPAEFNDDSCNGTKVRGNRIYVDDAFKVISIPASEVKVVYLRLLGNMLTSMK